MRQVHDPYKGYKAVVRYLQGYENCMGIYKGCGWVQDTYKG